MDSSESLARQFAARVDDTVIYQPQRRDSMSAMSSRRVNSAAQTEIPRSRGIGRLCAVVAAVMVAFALTGCGGSQTREDLVSELDGISIPSGWELQAETSRLDRVCSFRGLDCDPLRDPNITRVYLSITRYYTSSADAEQVKQQIAQLPSHAVSLNSWAPAPAPTTGKPIAGLTARAGDTISFTIVATGTITAEEEGKPARIVSAPPGGVIILVQAEGQIEASASPSVS